MFRVLEFLSVGILIIFAIVGWGVPFHSETKASPVPPGPARRRPRGDCEGAVPNMGASCPEAMDWLPTVAARYPRGHWLHVDVGANKGYGVLNVVAALSGDESRDPRRLHSDLRKKYWGRLGKMSASLRTWRRKQFCGMCCDCMKSLDYLPASSRATSVQAFAIDMSPTTAEWLKSFFENDKRVTVVHAGVSKEPGFRDVPTSVFAGDEMISLQKDKVEVSTGRNVTVRTPVMPLSAIVPPGSHIDYLSTDTEGFDRHVFEGARDLFVQQRVSVYVFEIAFHLLPKEHLTRTYLSDFVSELASLHYVCFLVTGKSLPTDERPQYVRLGPQCPQGAIDAMIGWSNVLCYNGRNATLRDVFEFEVADAPRKEMSLTCPARW